jgi:hypothetical protein
MSSIEWWAIITIAFTGSFGHCIGMCGGFIFAYSSTKIDTSMNRTAQLIRHSAYNFGRVSSYIMLGMILGGLGSLFAITMEMRGAVFILVGLLMLITALGMLGISSIIHSLERSFSSMPLFKLLFSRLIRSKSIRSFFALGMLNGFFPCGFVVAFAAKAISSASILDGGLIMAAFGLATIPALLALGQSINFMREIAFRSTMNRISALAILVYGLYSVYYGLAYFFTLPM